MGRRDSDRMDRVGTRKPKAANRAPLIYTRSPLPQSVHPRPSCPGRIDRLRHRMILQHNAAVRACKAIRGLKVACCEDPLLLLADQSDDIE